MDLESNSWTHFHWQVTNFEGIIFPGAMQRRVPFWWQSQVLKTHSFLTLCKERSHFGGIFAGKCVVKSKIAFGCMLHLHFDHLALATHVLLEWCTDDFLFGPAIIRKIHLLFSRTQKHLSPSWYQFDVIQCVELDWQLNCATFSHAAKLHFNYPLLLLGLDIAITFYELLLISTYISELIFNLPEFGPRI